MPCAAAGCCYPPSLGSKQITGRHGYAEAERTVGRSNGGWGGRRSSRGMLEMETQIQQFERDLMSASGFQEAKPGKKPFSTETAARSSVRRTN